MAFYRSLFLFFLLITVFTAPLQAQYSIPEVPKVQTSVYDYSRLFSPTQKRALEEKLIRYSDSTSTQIVVIAIGSAQGEDLNYLGANWLTKWGIGQKGKDNGILILLAEKDRKISIQNGYGIEHLLTDAMSKRIIERVMKPYFVKGDYYGGLDKGTDAIFGVLIGAYKGQPQNEIQNIPIGIFAIIIIFIVLIIILSKGGGRGNGTGKFRGPDLMDIIILSSMGRGGGFGGGSSGGGFGGGFGGGMGGGGGASGSW